MLACVPCGREVSHWASSAPLSVQNRALSYSQGADDNEGLWTAEFAADQCFRFLVTKQKTAKDIAVKNFLGMELLLNVTQVPGPGLEIEYRNLTIEQELNLSSNLQPWPGLLSRSIATDNQGDPTRWNLFNKTKYVYLPNLIFPFIIQANIPKFYNQIHYHYGTLLWRILFSGQGCVWHLLVVLKNTLFLLPN